MSIRKRESKKIKQGFTYQVYFPYKDSYGVSRKYTKSGFKTKKDALEHESAMKVEVSKHKDLVENLSVSLNEVFKEYMQLNESKYAKATLQYYRYTFIKYIQEGIGVNPIAVLKYKEIQVYFNGLECTLSNIENIKKIFNVSFKHAMRCGYIHENPMRLVNLNVVHKKVEKHLKESKKQVITKEELDIIIFELEKIYKFSPQKDYLKFNNKAYAIALYIGWYTGMRVSEVLALTKSDIDFVDRSIKVDKRLEYHGVTKEQLHAVNKLKTKASCSVVPLANPLKDILQAWFDETPYEVIVSDINGDYVNPGTLNHKVKKAAKSANIEDFHFHLLRHSFATNLVMNDINPSIAKELIRHGNIQTTLDIYTHIQQGDKSNAIDKLFGEEVSDE